MSVVYIALVSRCISYNHTHVYVHWRNAKMPERRRMQFKFCPIPYLYTILQCNVAPKPLNGYCCCHCIICPRARPSIGPCETRAAVLIAVIGPLLSGLALHPPPFPKVVTTRIHGTGGPKKGPQTEGARLSCLCARGRGFNLQIRGRTLPRTESPLSSLQA